MANLPLPSGHGNLTTSTFTNLKNKFDKAEQINVPSVELALHALQELQSNPQPTTPAQTTYPLTPEEYCCLLDVLPDLKDLRKIWGQYRIEYLYLAQQLVIMPSPGRRHDRAAGQTLRWMIRPIEDLILTYNKNKDNLSQKDCKTLGWYKQLVTNGTSEVSLPEAPHSPDASLGSITQDHSTLVVEVADSQRSQELPRLAADYLNLGRGLLKYMFAVDIRETAKGVDVDLIAWKYMKVGKNGHSHEQWLFHPLVRADGTAVDTTPTISYPLSDILGNPPKGCDNFEVVLHISDLIEDITPIVSRKNPAEEDKGGIFKRATGRVITPPHFKDREAEIKQFEDFESGSDDDDETKDKSFQP